ncbi:sensor histidine kinase [Fertoebacter nigrum]|uniref:C4-dicarboxylate transport sensor protein DctB n=2 Tax=Fertoeibacter niger TaxID=2656921 RepID=A0A8X8GVT1_9RHOB|nr:sensor histidine kinase [Fertoeibacter niger]
MLQGDRLATRFYLSEGMSRADTALRLTVNGLEGHLRRYEALPELLADHDDIRALFAPGAEGRRQAMNMWLQETNDVLQSSDIYVMGMDGTTIAASNYQRADSFIGQNFAYRPYFTEAAAGRNGRFYALGTTSGVRGYYFSAPVRGADGAVAGVIVFKIGLDALESSWAGGEFRILVLDTEGIIFMSSEPEWRYTAMLPLTGERSERTTASRRYSDATIGLLPHSRSAEQGMPLLRLANRDAPPQEYLEATQAMPDAGWTVHVLVDTAYLRGQARLAVVALLLLICAAGFGAVLVWQRRARLAERMQMQAAAQVELERRVDERTADLARVNALIEMEIAERRLTEQELRRTQADLVQAGKLAALGQMSAALSHEINQPLAAARNYADSAAILIDRGEPVRARENVGQILSLIDRMAAIAKHLRNVARKPNEPLKDLALPLVVAEAMQIVGNRLQAAGAEVLVDLAPDLPPVRGGAVRLQQVLVNVLSNAADATEDGPDRRIHLTAHAEGDAVVIHIRDHGPGVPAAIAERIFDPFFTTKRVGSGLGLGLSISYNIMKDFGGELRVANDPDGGAVFSLILQSALPRRMAAE